MEIPNAYDKYYSMKHFTVLLTIVFISLISSPSWSETMGDLVKRNDLYYKKFTNVPFTGEISEEKYKGHFKDGLKNGSWQHYTESEQRHASAYKYFASRFIKVEFDRYLELL